MPHKNKAQRAKNAAYNQIMFGAMAVSHLLFLQRLARMWAGPSTAVVVAYGLATLAGAWCARSISNTRDTARVLDIQDGSIGISYHLDVLILSIVSVTGAALLSDYFFLLFMCIPAYIVYKGLRMVLSWVFTPTESELEENFLMQQKRQEKASGKSRGRRSNKYSQRGR